MDKIYYFNSTHWDREWYQSFQNFRKYLVDTTEKLLANCQSDEFPFFTFDGQTVVLEDVCELRPSLRAELEKTIKNGKLRVGPWYVMPDEFLISLEALIRNLQIGRRTAEDFSGTPWNVGYICDIFGHIAQMPQILAGFGLIGAVVWRGFPQNCGPCVWWQGADGTCIPTARLNPHNGYGQFSLEVRGLWDKNIPEAEFKTRLKKFVEENRWYFGNIILLSDGVDHCEAYHSPKELLRWIHDVYPEAEIYHTDFTDFLQREFENAKQLPVAVGEQIITAADSNTGTPQISATLSSRFDVKQANDRILNMMENAIEPMDAWRIITGHKPLNAETMHYLWKLILKNHAHDSICGCSIDAVHRQVLGRFEEASALADTLCEELIGLDRCYLTGHRVTEDTFDIIAKQPQKAKAECAQDGAYTLRIFAPRPGIHTAVRTLEIPFPTAMEYPKRNGEPFNYEMLNSFKIFDAAEHELPYAIQSVRRNETRSFYRQDFRTYDVYTVIAQVTLRGPAWNSLQIRPCHERARYIASLRSGQLTADNGILALEINENGTFSVTDHRSGRTVNGLNTYSFTREIGDGWNHVRPANGAITVGTSNANIRLVTDAPARCAFEITRKYRLPRAMVSCGTMQETYGGWQEADTMTELAIVTTVALDKDSDRLQIKTVIHNNVQDYRLRLNIPTGIAGDGFVYQQGCFLTRSATCSNAETTTSFWERERAGKNFDGIIGKRDASGGIAFISRCGVHEGGVDDRSDAIFVTLLRAFKRTVGTNDENDGELQKRLTWDYQLRFFASTVGNAQLCADMLADNAPLTQYLLATQNILPEHRTAKTALPFTIEGDVVLSALKVAEDHSNALIFRFLNPSDKSAQCILHFAKPVCEIQLCRLDETPLSTVQMPNDNAVKFDIAPNRFVTIKVTLPSAR